MYLRGMARTSSCFVLSQRFPSNQIPSYRLCSSPSSCDGSAVASPPRRPGRELLGDNATVTVPLSSLDFLFVFCCRTTDRTPSRAGRQDGPGLARRSSTISPHFVSTGPTGRKTVWVKDCRGCLIWRCSSPSPTQFDRYFAHSSKTREHRTCRRFSLSDFARPVPSHWLPSYFGWSRGD